MVLRGNSASGKSSVAAGLRERYGRGIALVGQDNLRREVLREHDIPGGANIGLIDLTVRHALAHGFHVVLEGILSVAHDGDMLSALLADHPGRGPATESPGGRPGRDSGRPGASLPHPGPTPPAADAPHPAPAARRLGRMHRPRPPPARGDYPNPTP